MKNSYFFFLLFLASIFQHLVAQDCKILKNNSFKVPMKYEEVVATFKVDKYKEYHNSKENYIQAHIEWISDCEYNLLLQKNTLPNLPFEVGERLHVLVTKVKRNRVFYTATYNDRSWQGKMILIKPKP